jgi:predicted nicotinamide N-methyase
MAEDDESLSAVGFFFDAMHEKTLFDIHLEGNHHVKVKTIGDNPGHKQSGQYLWPAAEKAANYFIQHWAEGLAASRILELGAGCGLTGLVLSQFEGVTEIVFTDYDYGTLKLIEESIELNRTASSTKFIVDFLQWGDFEFDPRKRVSEENWETQKFDLIIGTDLLYSKDVVLPLFQTVKFFLNKSGKFVLTTSFSLGEVSLLFIRFFFL